MVSKSSKSKKKVKKYPFWNSTYKFYFNNTIITITDTTGNTVSWSSSGNKGLRDQKVDTLCSTTSSRGSRKKSY